MANTKISAFTELAETPNDLDLFPMVDVSDTTMAATGTNKYIKGSRLLFRDPATENVTLLGTVTAASFQGTANSYISGNLGIGTVTPGVKLHIAMGGGEVARLTSTSSNGNSYMAFSQNATRKASTGLENTDNAAFLSSWYGDIILRAASTAGSNTPTEYLRLKAGGNVGIGTAAPTAKLDVAGTVQMDALRLDQTPTAGAITVTHYINVNLNGTNYKIACGTA